MGWWPPVPDFLPPPQTWFNAGVLDNVLVRVYGQFYRLATALTLHADLRHLWGNIAFGALFLTLLARLTGVGRAVWLTLIGGILGNGLTVLFRPRAVTSLGFSTALFAAVGVLAGMMAGRQTQRRKAILPIAAGVRFGAYLVFIITSVLAAACDMAFVIMQRYNRPRLIKLMELQKRKAPTGE